jgi:hypothetical protein
MEEPCSQLAFRNLVVSRGVGTEWVAYFLCKLCSSVRVPGYRLRGPGLDSRRYEIFRVTVSLERDLLSLVRINEDLLEIKIGSGLETEINGRWEPPP